MIYPHMTVRESGIHIAIEDRTGIISRKATKVMTEIIKKGM